MDLDLSKLPATIDMAHAILALLVVIFFILYVTKKSTSNAEPSSAVAPVTPKAEPQKLKETTADSALQLLALLQQEARLVDFLQEDLSSFSDADIGAAARVVHEGGKKTLRDYFTLEPVRNENEETQIVLAAGFNASEIRLTGNVVGSPPFKGTLIHRGWKASKVNLPKLSQGHDASIVAPAEVEL